MHVQATSKGLLGATRSISRGGRHRARHNDARTTSLPNSAACTHFPRQPSVGIPLSALLTPERDTRDLIPTLPGPRHRAVNVHRGSVTTSYLISTYSLPSKPTSALTLPRSIAELPHLSDSANNAILLRKPWLSTPSEASDIPALRTRMVQGRFSTTLMTVRAAQSSFTLLRHGSSQLGDRQLGRTLRADAERLTLVRRVDRPLG